jgi:hypothetical protein
MNNSSIRTSLRECAAVRTRSGDVSPEPLPFLKLQMAVGTGGVLPAGVRAMLEACLRHDPRSRSDQPATA